MKNTEKVQKNLCSFAKIGAVTAENERNFAENLPTIGNYPTGPPLELILTEVVLQVPVGARACGQPTASVAASAGCGRSASKP